MTVCQRCHGTGVEPGGDYIYEGDRAYRLHPTATCPVCGSRLMFGDPRRNQYHCSAMNQVGKEEWLSHFEASVLIESPEELRAVQAQTHRPSQVPGTSAQAGRTPRTRL